MYSFIVELHFLIKGHNPVKEKSNFPIFCVKQTFFVHRSKVLRLCQSFLFVFLSRQI